MNTLHTPVHHNRDVSSSFDWLGQVKLAIVLSVVAVISTIALAGRVAEPTLIVGVIVVASFAGWARVQPIPQPAQVPMRRR